MEGQMHEKKKKKKKQSHRLEMGALRIEITCRQFFFRGNP